MNNLENFGKDNNIHIFKEEKMENSNMKNMVVLRNLPSNIVEEAIIVLKSNKKVKKLQKIEKLEKQKNTDEKNEKKDKDYILKEAEMLVNSYISKLENKNKVTFKKENKKYFKLKKYAFLISLISILEFIGLLIK